MGLRLAYDDLDLSLDLPGTPGIAEAVGMQIERCLVPGAASGFALRVAGQLMGMLDADLQPPPPRPRRGKSVIREARSRGQIVFGYNGRLGQNRTTPSPTEMSLSLPDAVPIATHDHRQRTRSTPGCICGQPGTEPAFFGALLEATLYAHPPLHDDSPRLRFAMFSHPIDHALTIPVFTDEAKVDFAARGNVRIVSIPGRLPFEATRGASLTINPNDTWCTLYPEEISDLLATGKIAWIRKEHVEESEARAGRLDKIPVPLIKALRKALPKISGIKVAYVAGTRRRQPDCPDSLLIVLAGSAHGAEHEVRATATLLQPIFERLYRSVDVQHFNASEPAPDWIRSLGLKAVYRRRAGVSSLTSPYN